MATARLLAGAEDYNFGPCGKLLALARALRPHDVELDFVGRGSALELARRSPALFRSLGEAVPDDADARGVLSVMDPALALRGHDRGLPVWFVDSLYPDWTWDAAAGLRMLDWLLPLRGRRDLPALLERMAALPRHLHMLAGHAVATVSLVQRWGEPRRGDATEPFLRLVAVPPIVELAFRAPRPRDLAVLTFSGLSNLHTDEARRRRYLRETLELVGEPLRRHFAGRVAVALPESLHGHAAGLPGVAAPSHEALLELFNRAAVVLTAPGLTTILECVAHGAPVVLLPEQNAGQTRNLAHLAAGDLFPSVAALPAIADGGGAALAARQRALLEPRLGGFDGAAICAGHIAAGLA